MMADVCSIAGCDKTVKAKQLCSMHHQRLRRNGDPMYEKIKMTDRKCLWPNCNDNANAKGYCIRHYRQMKRSYR
jgi:hypothetical protein